MFRIKTPIEKITCAHVLSSEGGKPQVEKCITSITGDIKEEKLIRFDDKYCLTFPVLKDIHFLHSTNGKRCQI